MESSLCSVCLDVSVWLKSLRLHKYSHLFQQITYNEMMNLTEEWLEARVRLIYEIINVILCVLYYIIVLFIDLMEILLLWSSIGLTIGCVVMASVWMYCGSSFLSWENFDLHSHWNISQKHQSRLLVTFVVTEETTLNFEVSSCNMIFC